MTILKDFSVSSIAAGFVTVLVGYTGSAVLIFKATETLGLSAEELGSWMGALGIGMALTCIGLSLRYRTPVVTAWSTPGAALLVTALAGVPVSEAIGAFLFCATLIILCGVTGWFEKVMDRIPPSIAAAMLAGILARFGMDVFVAMQTEFVLALSLFVAYLVCKRLLPRYAIVIVLAIGIALSSALGLLAFDAFEFALTQPVFTMPAFNIATLIGVGIPLFAVTMASQNIPGVAAMRASGYSTPVSPLITWTGITTFILAPFGGFAYNLAAITAAICMGEQAHPDKNKRYTASVAAGIFYFLLGIFGATVGALFAAFPKELVLTIAGLALFSTIANALATAVKDEAQREPALITFLVTVSGVTLFGIGAAFWGLVAGGISMVVLRGKS